MNELFESEIINGKHIFEEGRTFDNNYITNKSESSIDNFDLERDSLYKFFVANAIQMEKIDNDKDKINNQNQEEDLRKIRLNENVNNTPEEELEISHCFNLNNNSNNETENKNFSKNTDSIMKKENNDILTTQPLKDAGPENNNNNNAFDIQTNSDQAREDGTDPTSEHFQTNNTPINSQNEETESTSSEINPNKSSTTNPEFTEESKESQPATNEAQVPEEFTQNPTKNRQLETIEKNDTESATEAADKSSANLEETKEKIRQSSSLPQPPKIVPLSIRLKRYRQFANRRDIATSPISTLNLEDEKDDEKRLEDSEAQMIEPSPPRTDPSSTKKKPRRKPFNNRKSDTEKRDRESESARHLDLSRVSTPIQARKTPRTRQKAEKKDRFEMPSPQVVLDIDAVRNQFIRGKIELLPLVERIDKDTVSTSDSMKHLKCNSIENDNKFNVEVPNSMGSGNASVRQLIEQNRKQIFFPVSCNRIARVKSQRSSRSPNHFKNHSKFE